MDLKITEKHAEILFRRNPGLTVEQAANRELEQAMRDGTADAVGRNHRKATITKALLFLAIALTLFAFATA